jgi:hypothetical protein
MYHHHYHHYPPAFFDAGQLSLGELQSLPVSIAPDALSPLQHAILPFVLDDLMVLNVWAWLQYCCSRCHGHYLVEMGEGLASLLVFHPCRPFVDEVQSSRDDFQCVPDEGFPNKLLLPVPPASSQDHYFHLISCG